MRNIVVVYSKRTTPNNKNGLMVAASDQSGGVIILLFSLQTTEWAESTKDRANASGLGLDFRNPNFLPSVGGANLGQNPSSSYLLRVIRHLFFNLTFQLILEEVYIDTDSLKLK
ncbi:hypothetical protein ACTXT7_013794 [Hymenolepis weldensis]